MARAQYIWLVWREDPREDCGHVLSGAFTVKHEMQSAIDRSPYSPESFSIERVRDGGTWYPTRIELR
jgi:hypothetical protein